MRLIDRISNPTETRGNLVELFQTWKDGTESLDHSFTAYSNEGYKGNGPVYALIATRAMTFSEARFIWRQRQNGNLFGDQALRVLEVPGPNQTTRDLLSWMEVDVSLAGNAYIYRPLETPDQLQRLRPDWVSIISKDKTNPSGYLYSPGGELGQAIHLTVEEVAHYAPVKDPLAAYKGQSWVQAVAREVDADTQMARHKNKFFHNAATPNMLIKYEQQLQPETRERLRDEFGRRYGSWENAYKTAIIDGGADVQMVGSTIDQLDFSNVQAAGESRLAAAAGVPPVIVGFSKGLESATYSNYAQAMRRYADVTLRPLWGAAAGALGSIVKGSPGADLWYDDRHIPFLQQDAADEAQIRKEDALTLEALIRSGYSPESAAKAVTSNDLTLLQHTGLVSVQLQPPGVTAPDQEPESET